MAELYFDSRTDYRQGIDTVLRTAKRELCIFDPDLKEPDFESPARAEALDAFLAADTERRVRIVLHNTDHLARYGARLLTLLKRHSHRMAIRQSPDNLRQLTDCFVLGDDVSIAVRFHADHYRGKLVLLAPEEVHGWRSRFEDLWTESTPAVPVTHLGL